MESTTKSEPIARAPRPAGDPLAYQGFVDGWSDGFRVVQDRVRIAATWPPTGADGVISAIANVATADVRGWRTAAG